MGLTPGSGGIIVVRRLGELFWWILGVLWVAVCEEDRGRCIERWAWYRLFARGGYLRTVCSEAICLYVWTLKSSIDRTA